MSAETAAVLVKASGHVYVERNGTRLNLAEGDAIRPTDTILTDGQSTAEIRFEDGATATLSPDSTLVVSEFAYGGGQDPSFVLNLAQGTMRSISGGVVKQNPEAFKIITPKATVGIRGTELFNSVQGEQEVHAVLLIGKGHVVVVTGQDGSAITLNSALQGVSLDQSGVMVRQAYTATELEQIVRDLAPSQLETPLPTSREGAANQEAEAPAENAQQTVSAPLSVIIVYEEAATGNTNSAGTEGESDATLMIAVENLAGTLVDAGFSVTTLDMGSGEGFFSALAQVGSVTNNAFVNLPSNPLPSQGPLTPETPSAPETPSEPSTPPAPETPVKPSPWDIVFEGDLPAGWGVGHLAGTVPADSLAVLVKGNINENVPMNAQTLAGGGTADDHVQVLGGLQSAALVGDVDSILGGMGSALETIVTGNDTLEAGFVDANSFIAGDAREIADGSNLTLGNDVITVGTLAGKVYGDAQNCHNASATLGNDVINITTLQNGGGVYGDCDYVSGAGGADTINITTMEGGSVNGGFGNDSIAIQTMIDGNIDAGAGVDTVTIASMAGGTFYSDGSDIVNIGTMSGGTFSGGYADAGLRTVGTLTDGRIILNQGRLSITGAMNGGTIDGSGGYAIGLNIGTFAGGTIDGTVGGDTMTIGTVTGGILNGGADGDTISVTTLSNGTINGGAGLDSIMVGTLNGGGIYNDLGNYDTSSAGGSITVTAMGGGVIVGSAGNDTVNITTATGGTIEGGGGIDSIFVGLLDGGKVLGEVNNDNITITTLSNGIVDGGADCDTISVGTMTGGAVYGDQNNAELNGFGDEIIVTLMGGGALVGGNYRDSITVTTMTGGTINAGSGADNLTLGTVNGNLTVSLGVDSDADSLTVGSAFTSGTITLQDFNTEDRVTLLGGGEGIYSQAGSVFSIYYADGRVIHISGGVLGADATTTFANLSGKLDGLDSLSAGTLMTAGAFASWATTSSPSASGTIAVNENLAAGVSAMNGPGITMNGSMSMGSNKLIVGGNMENGVELSGDVMSVTAATGSMNLTMGNDTISIHGTMSGGALYGDAQSISTGTAIIGGACGDDSITVTSMSGGAIYGDAQSLTGNAIGSLTGGNNIISVGSMSGGGIHCGTGVDNVTLGKVQGNVIVDLGNDSAADRITVGSFTSGTVNIKNFNAGDAATFALAGSSGVASQSGTTLTLNYDDGRQINVTLDASLMASTALDTYTNLVTANQLANMGNISAA